MNRWSATELNVLRERAIKVPTAELAAALGRTAKAVKLACLHHGIARKPGKVGRPLGYKVNCAARHS